MLPQIKTCQYVCWCLHMMNSYTWKESLWDITISDRNWLNTRIYHLLKTYHLLQWTLLKMSNIKLLAVAPSSALPMPIFSTLDMSLFYWSTLLLFMATKQKIPPSIQTPKHRDQFLLHKKARKVMKKERLLILLPRMNWNWDRFN